MDGWDGMRAGKRSWERLTAGGEFGGGQMFQVVPGRAAETREGGGRVEPI